MKRTELQPIVLRLPTVLRRHRLVRLALTLIPSLRRQTIRFNKDARLVGDIKDPCVREYFLKAAFEPEFYDIASAFLGSGGTFFDVGANFGFCTFGLVDCLREQAISFHLFEANRDICADLERSCRLHPDVPIKVVNGVVTDAPGMSGFTVKVNALGESCVDLTSPSKITNIVLDQYLQDNAIHQVEFMKMDIEGWEFAALTGAEQALKRGVFKGIYLEIVPKLLSTHGLRPNTIIEFLASLNYESFFCKGSDYNLQVAPRSEWSVRKVRGRSILLSPLKAYPAGHATDILAIHRSEL